MKVSHRAHSDYDSISDFFDLAPVYIKTYPTEILFELMSQYEDQFLEFTHWCHQVFFWSSKVELFKTLLVLVWLFKSVLDCLRVRRRMGEEKLLTKFRIKILSLGFSPHHAIFIARWNGYKIEFTTSSTSFGQYWRWFQMSNSNIKRYKIIKYSYNNEFKFLSRYGRVKICCIKNISEVIWKYISWQ